MKEVSAGIIIYRKTKEGPKFLLLYHGGKYWNFPKGKIESDSDFENGASPGRKETAFKTALREVREETGLGSRDLSFNKWFKAYDRFTYTRNKKKVFKTVIYYLAETRTSQVKISPREHNGFGWFLYRDALRMLMYQNLKNNLRKVYAAIQRKSTPHH
ncbi:MAG: NUDIX domain-containing protein [Patescibacteria group bacterium]|nr:NUDIX domain-containing protein [Patescibacteria group bacterium]